MKTNERIAELERQLAEAKKENEALVDECEAEKQALVDALVNQHLEEKTTLREEMAELFEQNRALEAELADAYATHAAQLKEKCMKIHELRIERDDLIDEVEELSEKYQKMSNEAVTYCDRLNHLELKCSAMNDLFYEALDYLRGQADSLQDAQIEAFLNKDSESERFKAQSETCRQMYKGLRFLLEAFEESDNKYSSEKELLNEVWRKFSI